MQAKTHGNDQTLAHSQSIRSENRENRLRSTSEVTSSLSTPATGLDYARSTLIHFVAPDDRGNPFNFPISLLKDVHSSHMMGLSIAAHVGGFNYPPFEANRTNIPRSSSLASSARSLDFFLSLASGTMVIE